MADITATNKKVLDFNHQLTAQADSFPTLSVLDNTGKIVDDEAFERAELSNEDLINIIKRIILSRQLDIRSTKLAKQGRFGFFAPTAGQEASQMASSYAFNDDDWLMPGYRDIPQIVVKGWPIWKAILWSRGHVLGNVYTTEDDKPVNSWMPQIIIGAQYVEAAGIALGLKKRGKNAVVYAYTGDGGTSQGDFYEGINFAGAYNANAVFFVQNNGYAISTPRALQTAAPHLAAKGWAAGLPSLVVDGNDPIAVYLASKEARAWAANGNGPVLIETITNRLEAHSTAGDDPLRYRTKDDIGEWWKKEPLIRMRKLLQGQGIWNEEQEDDYVKEVNQLIDDQIKIADSVEKQKISNFIKNTLEVPSQAMKEQIAKFESEGK
ncbi:pyruvate dehydrogenase (acetyl-transferring) E1 component subunit alpha [Leuconostoc mesenteroides subsp. mesenteroides]|uniref:thiamine pyrophosphate-dependent dehydrogenase E1 component subunit alpha n=1 Tax=Leuconostoc mesenteroides TaxID=1245 RepID=UPI000A0754E2|nr:thiamine pyrophosphate-dependent dehydrogenase E1 component subunit alpha [Leuconostoc mesenteroides]ARN63196.1 pyruvate dehydrogenase (acetyl-transferring) E1 component subunit alpha [Leuconostoc mesenteroides subsp. mesenteroides]MDV8926935.1 thiamine pyrophosphate-dependent dehydrogenase E1 component subunit alpha [Leuconostoc mesenteroides]ORI90711.1 pyruvate dehydrogenase (acetyl-transferring) E1 component subunit alpha [Leuconostoc mesenteroides subsp. mesenteroides]ORI91975.1 pyruvate